MENDGSGGQTLPAATNEPQELAALHTGHTAGHLPASEGYLRRLRGPHAGPGRQRVLSRLPRKPDDQVPEVHQAVQG